MWLSLLLVSLCGISLSIEEAETTFDKYMKAVRAGDREKAVSYWNREEVEMYDPDCLDWQLTVLTSKKDISQFSEEIISANETEDYVELIVEWRDKRNAAIRKDHRYFIAEDDKLACANPIKVHTRGWLRKELNYIVYHMKPEEEPESVVLLEIDKFCEEASALLGLTLDRKIHCYKVSTSQDVGDMFGLRRSAGRAYIPGYTVVCMTHFPQYEVAHIFRRKLKERFASTILYRGLGVYLGGGPFFSPHLCVHWAKQLITKWDISLDEIDEKAYAIPGDPSNRYGTLSGAFVKYLVDEYGADSFKRIYLESSNLAELKESLKTICGKSASQIEEDWKHWLLNLEIDVIEPGIDPEATEVFASSDPEYDDKGDGDYVYPVGRLEGIFDLTGFRVLADKKRAYFELAYRNLVNGPFPEDKTKELTCSDWGFKDTFTKIAISTGAESGQSDISGNVLLNEPYNFHVDISGSGVLIRNADGIWLDLLRVKSEKAEIREGNKIGFSVPVSIIGKPDKSWKYGVLVGSHAGREWMSHGVGRLRKVGRKATKDQGGGGLDSDLNPNVYDILLPQDADQAEVLGSYDEATGKESTVPLVGKE